MGLRGPKPTYPPGFTSAQKQAAYRARLAAKRGACGNGANGTAGYPCPKCKVGRTSVIDTRQNSEGHVRRRRVCLACGQRLTTLEVPIGLDLPEGESRQAREIKRILPNLFRIADWIDELRAEHEP